MMKYLSVTWNTAVCVVVGWLIFGYRYWLFVEPFKTFEELKWESPLQWVLSGPIYLGLFVAYGLHFSTVYSRMTKLRYALLIITTCLPILGIALIVRDHPDFINRQEYFNQGGLLLFLSSVVILSKYSLIQILFGLICRCGRIVGFSTDRRTDKEE